MALAAAAAGLHPRQRLADRRSWANGDGCLVLESGEHHVRGRHDRLRGGMIHLALWAGTRDQVEDVVTEALQHGWTLMFPDWHPHAGGPDSYASSKTPAASRSESSRRT